MDDDIPSKITKSNWIPELKSIVALFIGLFCILCFKKLIGFGRRWKNILIDWGYRSLNVPSLWIPDAIYQGARSTWDHAPPINFGINVEAVKKQFRRVPALRLPDAWANFLLTWMYLNLGTVSSLIPVWISAVNEELAKATARSKKLNKENPRLKGYQLELKCLLSDSIPPRLSAVETSASGSTKELHFRCTLYSPCVSFQVELSRPSSSPDASEPQKTVHVLRLRQNACRVQLICAALEGEYVLLSWRLISPLIVNQLSLLSADLQEDKTMEPVDARWIKDTLYQGIQSAVTRIILSPLSVTPVQKLTANHSVRQLVPASLDGPFQLKSTSGLSHPPDCLCSTDSFNNGAYSVHIRLVSAILLKPLDQEWLSELRRCAWRCQLRSNPSLNPSRKITDHLDDGACVLATTPAAYLESRSWPTEQQVYRKPVYPSALQPMDTSSTTFVVVWNFDTQIPTSKLNSDLLDVVLFTESDADRDTSFHVTGHAILPLATSSGCCAHTQHVVLVDCLLEQSGGQANDEHRTAPSHESVRSLSVKFMLTLKVQLSPVGCEAGKALANGERVSQTNDIRCKHSPLIGSARPHLLSSTTANNLVRQSLLSPSAPVVSLLAESGSSSVEPSVDPLSPEQITDFMSKPTSSFEQNGALSALGHGKSQSFYNETRASKNQPIDSSNARNAAVCRRSESQLATRSGAPNASPISTGFPVSTSFEYANASNKNDYSADVNTRKTYDISCDSFSAKSSPSRNSPVAQNIQTPPVAAKKHRRFFRFRSNTTSSQGSRASGEQMHSELASNGISNFVEGFIEPTMAVTATPESKADTSGTHRTFGSRLHRIFLRPSIRRRRRRKSYDHIEPSESSTQQISRYSHDAHSIM